MKTKKPKIKNQFSYHVTKKKKSIDPCTTNTKKIEVVVEKFATLPLARKRGVELFREGNFKSLKNNKDTSLTL